MGVHRTSCAILIWPVTQRTKHAASSKTVAAEAAAEAAPGARLDSYSRWAEPLGSSVGKGCCCRVETWSTCRVEISAWRRQTELSDLEQLRMATQHEHAVRASLLDSAMPALPDHPCAA